MRYKATHLTRYLYDAWVSQCQSEVRLTPRTLPWQTVIESHIHTDPTPDPVQRRTDYFGNEVRSFSIFRSHNRFSTIATSVVQIEPRGAWPTRDEPWDAVRDTLARHSEPTSLEAFEFVFDSPFVAAAPELAAYARPSFAPGRPLLAAVQDLTHRLHTDFAYTPKSTAIDTPLLDTLRTRRGVCQDFSHVMIGALRSLHLAARYVSGYLRSGTDFQGSEASHAWVSVFFPGTGWVDFDPTNDVMPDTNHLTVAWGRDYGDVTPVKGVALGGGKQVVEVEVRVEEIP